MNVHGMKASSYFRSRVADVNSDECAAGDAARNNDIEPRKQKNNQGSN
jgi:hypothetical protein